MKIGNILITSILYFCFFGNAVADIDDGLVAHYIFQGNANDISGNGNNATIVGLSPTEGRRYGDNDAYHFNGIGFIEFDIEYPELHLGDHRTLSFWFKLENNFIPGDVMSFSSGTLFAIQEDYLETGFLSERDCGGRGCRGDGTPLKVYTESFRNLVDIFDSTWHNFVQTVMGSYSTVYIDGNLIDSFALSYSYDLHLGFTLGAGAENFVIDDLRVYNRSFPTNEEVWDLYQCELIGNCNIPPPACGTVSTNLNVYMPSLNYTTPTGTQNIWANFEFYGVDSNSELLWRLIDYGVNQCELIGNCNIPPPACGTVSTDLNVYTSSLNYTTPTGTQNIWANFEFYGVDSNSELLWRLIDYGVYQ